MKSKGLAVTLITIVATFISCSTDAAARRRPSGPAPQTLLVVNQGSQTLSFVDAATLTVRKSIPMSPAPHEVTLSSDGATAYVSLYGNREVVGDSIAVIDVAGEREVRRFVVGGGHKRPHGSTFRDGKLYVTSEVDHVLLRLDPATGAVEWTGDTRASGSHMLALSPDGKRIYSGNIGSNSVSVLDVGSAATSVANTQITVGKGPEGIALSPDGKELWVAHRGGGGVSVIDTATEAVVATLLPEVVSARVAFTPDSRKVLLFDMNSSNVVVVNRATRQELGRVKMTGMPGGGIVAGDGRTAFVTVYEPFSVTRIDLDKLAVTGSVETGIAPDGMALSGVGPATP